MSSANNTNTLMILGSAAHRTSRARRGFDENVVAMMTVPLRADSMSEVRYAFVIPEVVDVWEMLSCEQRTFHVGSRSRSAGSDSTCNFYIVSRVSPAGL